MIDADDSTLRRPHTRRRLPIGGPQQYQWLRWLIFAVLALNLSDALFTLLWVDHGLAREGNVLMRSLVHGHPVSFVAVKVALVGLGSYLLWRSRRRPLAVIGIFAVFLAYYFVLLYHLQYAGLMLHQMLHS